MPDPKKIYPRINFTSNLQVDERGFPVNIICDLETYVRVKHDGKWYLQRFWNTVRYPAGSMETRMSDIMTHLLTEFHFNMHLHKLFGRIDPTITDTFGEPIWKLDPDQRDEYERMESMLPHPLLK